MYSDELFNKWSRLQQTLGTVPSSLWVFTFSESSDPWFLHPYHSLSCLFCVWGGPQGPRYNSYPVTVGTCVGGEYPCLFDSLVGHLWGSFSTKLVIVAQSCSCPSAPHALASFPVLLPFPSSFSGAWGFPPNLLYVQSPFPDLILGKPDPRHGSSIGPGNQSLVRDTHNTKSHPGGLIEKKMFPLPKKFQDKLVQSRAPCMFLHGNMNWHIRGNNCH